VGGGGVMQSAEKFLRNLLNAILPNRAAPVLGRVIKGYEGPGKNTYSVDVRVVTAGTYEETDQVIAEVPISNIWTTKKGKGIYAIPPVDTLVIVEFLQWNQAYPYVSGIWSDEYDAAKFKKDQLVITDGKDLRIEFSDDEILVHDSNKFQHSFKKGRLVVSNDRGLVIDVNSDAGTILHDNGKGCSVFLGTDAITINGKGSTIVLNASGVTVNGAKINLN
jgi:hypothetical protein